MLIHYLVPITITFAVLALAMLAATLLLRRHVRGAATAASRAEVYLDDRAATLPILMSAVRADLAERDAGIEQKVWAVARLDAQLTAATAALAERRRAMDELRERIAASRVGIERIKSALRMVMSAIELRRTILG